MTMPDAYSIIPPSSDAGRVPRPLSTRLALALLLCLIAAAALAADGAADDGDDASDAPEEQIA